MQLRKYLAKKCKIRELVDEEMDFSTLCACASLRHEGKIQCQNLENRLHNRIIPNVPATLYQKLPNLLHNRPVRSIAINIRRLAASVMILVMLTIAWLVFPTSKLQHMKIKPLATTTSQDSPPFDPEEVQWVESLSHEELFKWPQELVKATSSLQEEVLDTTSSLDWNLFTIWQSQPQTPDSRSDDLIKEHIYETYSKIYDFMQYYTLGAG